MTQVFTVRIEGRFDPLVPKKLTRAIYRAMEYACDNDVGGAGALNWDDIDQFTVTHAEAAVPEATDPADWAPMPDWAVATTQGELCLGAHLPTRDGRRIGNAHIIGTTHRRDPTDTLLWRVLTDAGSQLVLDSHEVQELFYPPRWVGDVKQIFATFGRTTEPEGPVTVEPCPCGHPGCSDYHLRGIGKFVQGSGFTLEEATRIARLLNEND